MEPCTSITGVFMWELGRRVFREEGGWPVCCSLFSLPLATHHSFTHQQSCPGFELKAAQSLLWHFAWTNL